MQRDVHHLTHIHMPQKRVITIHREWWWQLKIQAKWSIGPKRVLWGVNANSIIYSRAVERYDTLFTRLCIGILYLYSVTRRQHLHCTLLFLESRRDGGGFFGTPFWKHPHVRKVTKSDLSHCVLVLGLVKKDPSKSRGGISIIFFTQNFSILSRRC